MDFSGSVLPAQVTTNACLQLISSCNNTIDLGQWAEYGLSWTVYARTTVYSEVSNAKQWEFINSGLFSGMFLPKSTRCEIFQVILTHLVQRCRLSDSTSEAKDLSLSLQQLRSLFRIIVCSNAPIIPTPSLARLRWITFAWISVIINNLRLFEDAIRNCSYSQLALKNLTSARNSSNASE